jgi:hypothetical protein
VKKQTGNPFDWNLVSCSNPLMHHISPVLRSDEEPSEGKWTFLITSPTVSHSHL